MKRQSSLWCLVAAGIGLLSFSYQARAEYRGKLLGKSRAVEAMPGEFVIKLKNSAGATAKAFRTFGASGLQLVETLNLRQNIHLVKALNTQRLASTLGLSSEVSQKTLQKETLKLFGSMPEVEYMEPNFVYRTLELRDESDELALPDDTLFEKLWGMHNTGQKDPAGQVGIAGADIKAPEAWEKSKGSHDIVVAIVDTGVDYTHPDLEGNIWTAPKTNPNDPDVHGYNAITDALDPMDDHSHGTHCAGTIGARGANGQGVVGVNWDVSIMGVKFLSGSGSGTLADAIKAIDWATAHNVNLMSNSWGGGGFSQALYDAIDRARQKGILFVAAAGNDGSNNDDRASYPASYALDNVVSVAASTNQDTLAYFSNYGQKTVHLMAPGFNIMSTVLNHQYNSFSGTSMATPHVSGAAALLMAAEPGITYTEVKARLISSADKSRAFKRKLISAGRLNLFNLLSHISPPGPIVPPESSWRAETRVDIRTPNPYLDNSKLEWTIEHPGAKFLRVRFKEFNTEAGYDFVKLYSEAGEESDSYSGTLDGNVWSGEIEGAKARITFESDTSVSRTGFVIDAFEWTDYAGQNHLENVNISAR
jgi:thermitase